MINKRKEDEKMDILNIISGPLIGSVIGYGTNYIAVKMLFRPLYPVKWGKHTLPFTPGIIPRGKKRLAKALGTTVGEKLLTKEDLEQTLLSPAMKAAVAESVLNCIEGAKEKDESIRQILQVYMTQLEYDKSKEKIKELVSRKIVQGISKLDIGSIIVEEGTQAIKEKTQGTMFAMFITDDFIASMAEPIGIKVNEYIDRNGEEKIWNIVSEEIDQLEEKSISEFLEEVEVRNETLQKIIETMYTEFVRNQSEGLIRQFHIEEIVEEKVKEMDVLEVEEMVLSVMKKELNTLVNLGAVIGFLIGILNIFI